MIEEDDFDQICPRCTTEFNNDGNMDLAQNPPADRNVICPFCGHRFAGARPRASRPHEAPERPIEGL